jgi:transcriptional regulator with XRE-family HTH domain
MSLATKLKELRIKKKASLQEVADAVESSKAHIWDLETGRAKNPSIELLNKLANFFAVGIAELVEESPSTEEEPQLIAMFRELKKLSSKDQEAIKAMIEHLQRRKEE